MVQTLQQRIEKVERQLHHAERLAARSGNSTAVGSEEVRHAISQARRTLVVLKIDFKEHRVPLAEDDTEWTRERARLHHEYLARVARRRAQLEAESYSEGDALAERGGRE